MIININKKQFNNLFENDEANKIIAQFILDYIDNAKNIKIDKNKSIYECIIEYFNLDNNYISLFENKFNLSKQISKLDVNEYINNPYNLNIKLENISYKNYKFEMQSFNKYEGFLCDEILVDNNYLEHTKIGYFEKDYNYLTLSLNNEIWMLITPHEINTMKKAINKANGNVITFGLGLGYFAYMCSIKDNVDSVTIIEKDNKIIELFNKFILPQFNNKDKIKIINEDAIKYLNNNNFNYDYAFIDLWHDNVDGLKLYIDTYKLSLLHKNTTFDFWIEKSMIIMLRRCLITLLYESINNIIYESEESYEDYLINKFKALLKDYVINTKQDIDRLLSESFIKDLITKI